ncbi:MAG TPA: diguanylate cyclase, partial [Telmatospirillum sp.]|nr:diguanylate cyclase [Telmatospirillum sp.]
MRADWAASVAEVNGMPLDAIWGRLTEGVLTVDENGCVRSINPVAERIFDCSADQVVGMAAASLLPDWADPAAIVVESFQDIPAGELREWHVSRADGLPLTLQISVSHVTSGGCHLTVVVLRDVSVPRQIAAINALVQEVNQRVLQGEDMEFLTPFLCRRIMGLFNLRLVWIAGKRPDGSFAVLGFAGPPAMEQHFNSMHLRWDGVQGEPAALAILSGDIQWIEPTVPDWLELQDAATGPQAGVSIPLCVGKTVLGALTAYADARIATALMPRLERLADHLGIMLQVMSDQRRLLLQGAAIGAAANAIFITDGSGCIQWVNDAFTRLSGYGLDEAVGRSPNLLRSGVQTKQVYQDLWSTIHAGDVWRGELVERRKDGTLYTVEQTVTPMRDRKGTVSHFVVVHEDITDRKHAEERIRFLSNFDAMTGLPNRGLFRERLILALSRADGARKTIAILFLDLDHFSRINDTMGHDLGDRLLEKIVDRLAAVTRSADTLARVGGDEFAVILEEQADKATVVILARRLLNAVSRPYD